MSDILMPPGGGRRTEDVSPKVDDWDEDFLDDDFYDDEPVENYAATAQNVSAQRTNPRKKSAQKRNVQKRNSQKEAPGLEEKVERLQNSLRISWLFFGGIIVGFIIFLVIFTSNRARGEHREYVLSLSDNIPLVYDPTVLEESEALYYKYLTHAYIILGTYPDDCELIKISDKVSRNDIDWTNDIRVNSKGLYYTRFKGEEDKGRVAIDVSEFQHTIDWEKVKAVGIDVAIIRVGYRGYGTGSMQEDSMFRTNIEGATAAGLDVGVYFFSSAINREEGIEEAQFVLDRIGDYNITQPIVIDTEYIFEDEAARANDISIEDRTAAVVGFCETIEAAGRTPMIYASRDKFLKYLDIEQIGNWEFWLAAYDTPIFPYHTEGYQYTPYGYVDGIETQVDLDVWMR